MNYFNPPKAPSAKLSILTNDIFSSFFNYLIYMQLLCHPFYYGICTNCMPVSIPTNIFTCNTWRQLNIYIDFFWVFFLIKKTSIDWIYTTIFIPFKCSVWETCVKSILLHWNWMQVQVYTVYMAIHTEIEKGMLKLKIYPLSYVYEQNISCFSLWGK